MQYHTTSHLNGRMPAGGNIRFVDGHAAWRNFRQMRLRTAPSLRPGLCF